MGFVYYIKTQDVGHVQSQPGHGWTVVPAGGCDLSLEALTFPLMVGDKAGVYVGPDTQIICEGCHRDACPFQLQEKGKGNGDG